MGVFKTTATMTKRAKKLKSFPVPRAFQAEVKADWTETRNLRLCIH
jgi:hypothetical protein